MVENLEGKIQAPTVVFADEIEFTGSGFRGVHLGRKDGNVLTGFASWGYAGVEAVYDSEGSSKWENGDYKPLEVQSEKRDSKV